MTTPDRHRRAGRPPSIPAPTGRLAAALHLAVAPRPWPRHRLAALLAIGLSLAAADALGQVSPDTVARRMLQEGRHDEALLAIDAELRKRPADGQMLLLKGAALSMAQRKDEAVKVFRSMAQRKIEEASAYNNLAVIYAGQGEYESARSALEWALRAKPDYVTAHHNLGNVYAQLASQSYKKALQLDRGDRSLPAKLAQLDEVLGQPGASGQPGQPTGAPGTGGPGAVSADGRRVEPAIQPLEPPPAKVSSLEPRTPSVFAAVREGNGAAWGGNGN